jgi:calcyclin binding protein
LRDELDELKKFLGEAKFERTKALLRHEILKVEAESAKIQAQANKSTELPSKPQRIRVDITEHAFDQSEKFVKIFIPFSASKIKDSDVVAEFTEDSFSILIQTKDNRDYRFVVNALLKKIDVSKSYRKVKEDMVSVYLKKTKEGDRWQCLTTTEKRLKDSKSKDFEEGLDKDESSKDPMNGLMSIMKKMYDSGDSEMKRTIAKAWQEKGKGMPMM